MSLIAKGQMEVRGQSNIANLSQPAKYLISMDDS